MKYLLTLVASTLLSASAVAAAPPVSLSVSTADLDLGTVSGQAILAKRIDRAATELCAAEVLSQSPDMTRAERRCIKAAKQAVESQIASRTAIRAAVN